MDFLLTILCFFIAYISYKRTNKPHNPVTLYLGTWALVFGLYTLNPYKLPSIHDTTYWIYIIGFIFFLLGILLVGNNTNKLHLSYKKRIEKTALFKALIVLMLVLMIIPATKAMGLLLSGVDLHDIRYVHRDDILGSGIVAVAFVYFCEPFITFLIVYSVINMFIGQNKFRYICLSIATLGLITVITGGRFFVLYFIASVLIALFIFRKSPTAKKISQYSLLLLGILVLGLVVISIVRGSDVIRTMYVYLSGSIPFMEERLSANENLPHTLGLACLYGFIRPVFVVLRAFLDMQLPLPLQVVETVFLEDDAMIMLTPEIHYNSFVSIFYSMYLDGGLKGVAIGNFILGFVAQSTYKRVYNNDKFSLILYILIAIIFLLSFFKLLICNYSYALSFVYLYCSFRSLNKSKL